MDSARRHAEVEGLASYLYEDNYAVYPPGPSIQPIRFNLKDCWSHLDRLRKQESLEEMICRLWNGKGANIPVQITTVFSRFKRRLPPQEAAPQTGQDKGKKKEKEQAIRRTATSSPLDDVDEASREGRQRTYWITALTKRWKCSKKRCKNHGNYCFLDAEAENQHFKLGLSQLRQWAPYILEHQYDDGSTEKLPDALRPLPPSTDVHGWRQKGGQKAVTTASATSAASVTPATSSTDRLNALLAMISRGGSAIPPYGWPAPANPPQVFLQAQPAPPVLPPESSPLAPLPQHYRQTRRRRSPVSDVEATPPAPMQTARLSPASQAVASSPLRLRGAADPSHITNYASRLVRRLPGYASKILRA